MESVSLEQARLAKPGAAALFSQFGKVVGVGIARIGDGYGIKVNLQEAPEADVKMPNNIDGVPIKVEVVGTIHKLESES